LLKSLHSFFDQFDQLSFLFSDLSYLFIWLNCSVTLGKQWPVRLCYEWLWLCLFWMVAKVTAGSSGRTFMICLVLKDFGFSVKYSWTGM
jgi:hypothetical protein